MKNTLLLTAGLAISACLCQATTLTIGSPNDNNYAGDTLSSAFGMLINFDNLTPFSTVASNAYAAQGIASLTSSSTADPLTVYPYSSQSAPNYLSTQDGYGAITITFTNPVSIVGIGVLESDGDSDVLTATNASGTVLATYGETVPLIGATAFNAYYVIRDTTSDIKSLTISSAAGNFGVDDLQFAPEPLNFALVGGGLGLLALLRSHKKAKHGA
jgi:hypothetical protein